MKYSLTLILLVFLASPLLAHDHPTSEHPSASPTVAEQVAGLEKMCMESSTARGERHEKEPLFNRLGGEKKIRKMFEIILAKHRVNKQIKHTMKGVDDKVLIQHLVDFTSAGTGGDAQYTGRSMPDAHRSLDLSDADFLAAGSDIVAGMQEMNYGQNEIDEFLCILVSLKRQIVFK